MYYFGKKVKFVLAFITPLAALWFTGALYHSNFLWLVSKSIQVESMTRSDFPVLDGVFGTLFYGGTGGILKFFVLFSLFALALFQTMLILRYEIDSYEKWISLSILIFSIILFIGLNQNTIWAAVRLGKISALPMGWFTYNTLSKKIKPSSRKIMQILIVSVLLLSQFLFGWYSANIFFS